jgi:ADP-heptose:LPS heptosyltransferase
MNTPHSATKITKFLILRFSSIGDIVLTSPVARIIKEQYPNAEVHFGTKKAFNTLIIDNPNIDKVLLLDGSIMKFIAQAREEKYDYIIDLHHNLRSAFIKTMLWHIPSYSFDKQNIEKWLYVRFKKKTEISHVVARYIDTTRKIGLVNDHKGLDFYINLTNKIDANSLPMNYSVFVIGAKMGTKQLPLEKMIELCQKIDSPIVLVGGKEDEEKGIAIISSLPTLEIINTCGRYNIQQSASVIQQSNQVFTHDTGMMHIAAAFNKRIVSIWGNTTPEIGFAPYKVSDEVRLEVKGLSCRPCSKIGFDTCPQGHFRCMQHMAMEKGQWTVDKG